MERKLPIVYVARELIETKSYTVVGYLVSKAYLKSENKKYLDNGKVIENYEVEFIGYENANTELVALGKYHIRNGCYVKLTKTFNNYFDCKDYVKIKNNEIVRCQLKDKNSPEKVPEAIEIANKHASILRLLSELESTYLIRPQLKSQIITK